MPINKITINEYECAQCGYRWINKINYKDSPIPTNCAKCKRLTWNSKYRTTPKENGYRRIVRGFKKLYDDFDEYDSNHKGLKINWPADLCDQFLNTKPSWFDLEKVIQSSQLRRFDNGKSIYRMSGWIPDLGNPGNMIRDPSTYKPVPDKPGYVRYDHSVHSDPKFVSDYNKWIVKEALVRKRMMIAIMKHIGIEYKPVTQKRDLKKDGPDKYMSKEEKLWRRRINEFHKRYVSPTWYIGERNSDRIDARIYTNWPFDLCHKFLNIKPRPTVEEMKDIFYDPIVKGVHKLEWDDEAEFEELTKTFPQSTDPYITHDILGTIRRKKLMIHIIQSRGEKYTYNEDLNIKILQDRFPIKVNN
jgi:hypothetical protein